MHWGRGCTSTGRYLCRCSYGLRCWRAPEREKKRNSSARRGGANVVVACPELTCQVGQGVGQLAASAPFAAPSVPEATAVLQCAHPILAIQRAGEARRSAVRRIRCDAGEQERAEGGR